MLPATATVAAYCMHSFANPAGTTNTHIHIHFKYFLEITYLGIFFNIYMGNEYKGETNRGYNKRQTSIIFTCIFNEQLT